MIWAARSEDQLSCKGPVLECKFHSGVPLSQFHSPALSAMTDICAADEIKSKPLTWLKGCTSARASGTFFRTCFTQEFSCSFHWSTSTHIQRSHHQSDVCVFESGLEISADQGNNRGMKPQERRRGKKIDFKSTSLIESGHKSRRKAYVTKWKYRRGCSTPKKDVVKRNMVRQAEWRRRKGRVDSNKCSTGLHRPLSALRDEPAVWSPEEDRLGNITEWHISAGLFFF